MTKKPKVRELELSKVLDAVDYKNYDFYKSLTDKQKKEFSAFVMMRFISGCNNTDVQEWFVETVNEFVNKNHWAISKHPELQWKLCAATGIGRKFFHEYIPALKPELDKFESLIAELHPSYKIEDIQLLSKMMTKEDREELFDKMGFDKIQRKEYQ